MSEQTRIPMFHRNPFKPGTQNWTVYEIFTRHGGVLKNWQLRDLARAEGILNPTARVSNIKEAGIGVVFDKPTSEYRMERAA